MRRSVTLTLIASFAILQAANFSWAGGSHDTSDGQGALSNNTTGSGDSAFG